MEATKGIGHNYTKEATNDCYLFVSWFFSQKAAESSMEVVAKLIGMVKKNTKDMYKETIGKITKDWLRCSYLVLRNNPMVTRAGC